MSSAGDGPSPRGARLGLLGRAASAACALVAVFGAGEGHAQSLSTVSDGNSDRLRLTPSVRASYDTNVLRLNDTAVGPRDNVRVTAGVDVIARRTFGRTAIDLGGTIGYDVNSRFEFLDRTRIELDGRVRTPVGAICSLTFSARYLQAQFELDDVEQVIGATDRQQYYDLLASCNRSAGFSPLAGVTYSRRSTDAQQFRSSDTLSGRAGVSYARPSLGVVSLIVSRARIGRPDILTPTPIRDGTDITQARVSLRRDVSPRVSFNAGIGYVNAEPDRAGVGSFSGLSYEGEVAWRPTPRLTATASAGRDVTTQTGINSTYVIRDDYRLAVDARLSARSRLRGFAARVERDFRGRQPLPGAIVIGEDATDIVGATYSYDTARLFRISASASKRWRRADVAFFDYESTIVSLSIGARF